MTEKEQARDQQVEKGQAPEKKAPGRKPKSWIKKTENIALVISLFISVLTLVLAAPSIHSQWFPPVQRARLTLFIDHTTFTWGSGDISWSMTVYLKVVNDSPMTATIRTWNLTPNFNMTYKVLDEQDSHLGLILQPSSQTDFNMTRNYIGENNTMLPWNSLRSVTIWMSYEDYLGMQEARREYGYV